MRRAKLIIELTAEEHSLREVTDLFSAFALRLIHASRSLRALVFYRRSVLHALIELALMLGDDVDRLAWWVKDKM